jgi:N-acetylglucosamine-6-phosphate deacetylase
MKRLIITNGKFIFPSGVETEKILVCQEGKIKDIIFPEEFKVESEDQIIDAKGQYVSPGFIDMHIMEVEVTILWMVQ